MIKGMKNDNDDIFIEFGTNSSTSY